MTGIPALKEWAVICNALLAGEQIIDLRKGGLKEDGRHFGVNTPAAWLYPTVEHQRPELVKPAYRRWIDTAPNAPVGSDITVHGWVQITETHQISEQEVLEALTSKVIWSHDYAASRMNWKQRDPLWVLVMRAHRLVEPIVVPWSQNYGGCTSWVDFEGMPLDPTAVASTPAISDDVFEARRKGVREALGLNP